MSCNNLKTKLTKDSFDFEVISWLKSNSFDDSVITSFEDESVDGEVFFSMEMWMIERLIKGMKNIMRFRKLWSQETNMIFDMNGSPIPNKKFNPVPVPLENQVGECFRDINDDIGEAPAAQTVSVAEPRTPSRSEACATPPPPVTPNSVTSSPAISSSTKSPANCSSPALMVGRGRSAERNVKVGWAQSFEIPEKFSANVDMGIQAGKFNPSQRNEFMRDVCTLIATNTRYPTEAERQLIAQKIVAAFPFLRDPIIGSSSTEWGSWENKIRNRMKRLQRTTSAKGVLVCRTNLQETPATTHKRQKTMCKPWLVIPDFGKDETEETLEVKKQQLRKICRLPKTDSGTVKTLMAATYPLRRKMVLEGQDNVEAIVKSFPPLLKPVHLKLEMNRVMGDPDFAKHCKNRMVDTWLPKVLKYAQSSDKLTITKLLGEMDTAVNEGSVSETECNQRAAIFILINELLRNGGGRKHSGVDKLVRLLTPQDSVDDVIHESVSPTIVLSGEMFDLSLIYIVGEHRVLCDLSKDDKLLDALLLLLFTYYVYDYSYSIQRNALVFLENVMLNIESDKLPVSVTQVYKVLQEVE